MYTEYQRVPLDEVFRLVARLICETVLAFRIDNKQQQKITKITKRSIASRYLIGLF